MHTELLKKKKVFCVAGEVRGYGKGFCVGQQVKASFSKPTPTVGSIRDGSK